MIEFYYSGIVKCHSIRTKGIVLKGVGIKEHHSEEKGAEYNVYSLTKKAFARICSEYPQMKMMN